VIIIRRIKPKTSALFSSIGEAEQRINDAFREAKERAAKGVPPPKFNFDFMDNTPKQKISPGLLLAGLGATAAVGAGAYFIRRRKSKNGKQVVERVRKK